MATYSVLLRCGRLDAGLDNASNDYTNFQLATDGDLHGVFLTNEDGEPRFVLDNDEATQGIERPDATMAIFHTLGTSLTLEPLVGGVYIDSPPLPSLPKKFGWGHIDVPASNSEEADGKRRLVYLRPHDMVVFPNQGLHILIIARDITLPIDGEIVDVQVKSSIADAGAGLDVEAEEATDGEETDDADDLDVSAEDYDTPAMGAISLTPATSRPTDGAVAVKETPSRRLSNDTALPFSTAPDRLHSPRSPSNAAPDTSTPTTRAAESQELRRRAAQKPSEELGDSQYVFPRLAKNQVTYGRRSKYSSTSPKLAEVIESQKQAEAAEQSPLKIKRASSPKYDQSSEPMDEAAAAMEVASRSRRWPRNSLFQAGSPPVSTSGSKKRKQVVSALPDTVSHADVEGNLSSPPAKKFKRAPGHLPKAARTEEEAANDESNGGSDPSSSEKLKRLTRVSTDLEFDDSITAKPRKLERFSSPHVRIPPHSSATAAATPSSSSSSATRPSNKLLLSASSHANKGEVKKFLTEQGLTVCDKVPSKRTPLTCVVGNGDLHTTVKLLRSLAMNKRVVTDQWLTDSMEAGELLDMDNYTHEDVVDVDRSKVFAGRKLYFTTTLHQSYGLAFKDVQELAKEAGATHVDYGSSARKAADMKNASDVIFLGNAREDPMARELMREHGKTVYTKDLLTQSIIRGELLLDEDEFKIAGKAMVKKGRGR